MDDHVANADVTGIEHAPLRWKSGHTSFSASSGPIFPRNATRAKVNLGLTRYNEDHAG